MRRTLGSIIVIITLIIGLGLGEVAWMRLSAAGCLDWQSELQRRVESYARMHLPDPAPQIQVQTKCGHSFIADALYFRWHKLLWRMDWHPTRPLEEGDLRMGATRDLMQHPDMGSVKFVVKFDSTLSRETRKRVEDLIGRYLMVEEPRQKLEFKRVKKLPEKPAAQGSILALEPPLVLGARPFHPPLFPAPEPQLRSSLIQSSNAVFAILLACVGGLFIMQILAQLLRTRKKVTPAPVPSLENQPSWSILVAPRVLQDFSERGREVWRLLTQLDRERAARRVQHYWEHDREALLQFLGWLDSRNRESMLSALNTDQLLKLTDVPVAALAPRDAQRAALRILLDLARELGQCSQLASAPLFIHLMTRREWQSVAQHMTRPRRRALAELLDKERAGWLRARQDLHPGWFQSGTKEATTHDQLVRRVRATLQVDADHLREQLSTDRETLQVVDSYFADLTLDTGLNTDLMMLVLGECYHRHAGFGRLVERRDQNLLLALRTCDDQQVALLLYECDAQIKQQVYAILGERGAIVAAMVQAMEYDKQHGKSLRMQARSLQRFMERQVLVADLLCASPGVHMT
ncbi:MAG TPA: hypothetical protein VE954_10295 [Oligoflexus sp.]|uniref:hypothetical protein n=1 Tax=Oligoflexus sp. TaxID=1971216 RepID=UPI002D355189|nr:hypothetical protein [Oligoflexus sp.]HYX33493.1 hypothetical protein [Oligoflexus sp.]